VTAATPREKDAPLEDVMVAMDVVDTLRHQRLIVERELDAEARRRRLVDRLRDIYAAQGIDVTDEALEAGVDALEQERFAYQPAAPGLATALAKLYVRRDRWLRPLLVLVAIGALLWSLWFVAVEMPASRNQSSLLPRIEAAHGRVVDVAKDQDAEARAADLLAQGRQAVAGERYDAANAVLEDLQSLDSELRLSFEVRIVSRPGEYSAVWRIPEVNPGARNFYLVVEAIDERGEVVPRRITSEEDGSVRVVRRWGLRVDEATYEAVAADKTDDGIIQDNLVGTKKSGRLGIDYAVPTTGATISEW